MPKRVLIDGAGLREKGIRYSRAHRVRLISAGRFPAPVKDLGRENLWLESEIDAYIEKKIADRIQRREETVA